MFNKRVLAIIKRELREKLSSKAFIIMTILMPVLILLMGALPALFMNISGGTTHLKIVSEVSNISANLKTEMDLCDFVKDKSYQIEYSVMSKSQFSNYLKSVKPDILDDKISAVIFIPASASIPISIQESDSVKNKTIEYFGKTYNQTIKQNLDNHINKVLVGTHFQGVLSGTELSFSSAGVNFKGFTISKDNEVKEQSYGNLILSYVVTILLFMGLIQTGAMAMQSVIEEKSNRIVEIILSSMKPRELLAGKIIGASITGLAQMIIWLTPVVLISSGALFVLPKEFTITLSSLQLIYILVNFLFGLLIYVGLYAMVGSIFDNAQDAQQGMFPVMMLIMIPYFISFSLLTNPTSAFAIGASLFPFANLIIMPVRFTIVDVPLWHLLLSVVINIITLYFVFGLAGRIYRVGILKTGKKPKWSEVIKWVRYKD